MPEYDLNATHEFTLVCVGCGRAYSASDLPNDSRCEDCFTMLNVPQIDDEHATVINSELPTTEGAAR
jgi:hypothetical protein